MDEFVERIEGLGFKKNRADYGGSTKMAQVTSYKRANWVLILPDMNRPWVTVQHEVRGTKDWFVDYPVEMGIDLVTTLIITMLEQQS